MPTGKREIEEDRAVSSETQPSRLGNVNYDKGDYRYDWFFHLFVLFFLLCGEYPPCAMRKGLHLVGVITSRAKCSVCMRIRPSSDHATDIH